MPCEMFTLRKRITNSSIQSQSVFEDLVKRHEASIFRVAYRLTGNHEDAEDLVQEALLEAYEAFDRFRAGTYFDRWLFRILRNTYIDKTRSRPKVSIQSLDATFEKKMGACIAHDVIDWSSPETRLMESVLAEPLQQALMALSEEFRLVIVLSDMEGLTYEEVSRVVGCPVGTVRSRLHRARMLMKESLRGYPSASDSLPNG